MSEAVKHEPIRVLVLSHVARLSGAELGLCRLLPAMGSVRPHVILGEDGPLVERLTNCGVSVEVLPMRESARALPRDRVHATSLGLRVSAATAAYTIALATRIRRIRPDVVHASSLKALVYGLVAARLSGTAFLWHAHDRIADDYLPPSAARLVRGLARQSTTVVVASRSTLETLGPAASRAVVIPYPVVPLPAQERRQPCGPCRVGMVGRIAPWKGQHIFLQAFARAFPNGDEQAVIVGAPLFGEERYEDELRTLCLQLGLDDRVEFRGFRTDVPAELGTLDILVHSSTIPEPFGQVVAEGMAAGLPVVAAGAGGPSEILVEGRTGFLCPPRDIDALAERLQLLARDPELRRRVGEAARLETASLAPELIAERMTDAYRTTLARAGVVH
jgi:glycosyltransferase involved in cell wall biosynthesis